MSSFGNNFVSLKLSDCCLHNTLTCCLAPNLTLKIAPYGFTELIIISTTKIVSIEIPQG